MSDDVLSRHPQVAGNPRAMALMCQALHANGSITDAYALGRAAIDAAPHDEIVRDLVHGVLSAGVPKYHRRMLRDVARNRAYARAVEYAVRPGMLVLEIGTGAGLVAMMAARAGAMVVTCEANPTIAAAAREVVRRNGLSDRITVISKHSTALTAGEDLPAPADMLVSELFGNSLFEEGVVDSIGDARRRLLAPDAAIVPPRAELRLALVSHDRTAEPPLDMIEGFDLSAFELLARPPRVTFSSRDLDTLMSDAQPALALDFGRIPFGERREVIELVSHGGKADGVAQWLRIDFGHDVIYENAPQGAEYAHWGIPVRPFAAPIETRPGDRIAIEARLAGNQLLIGLAR